MNLIILIAVGFAGGLVARALNLPGGAAVGALLAAAVVSATLPSPTRVPVSFDITAQVLVGVVVGAGITRDALSGLVGVILPALVILVTLSLVGLGLSVLLQRWFGIDLVTALFATAPGGMSNMAILAREAGGDGFTVAIIHMVRLVGIFIVIPIVSFFVRGRP